MAVIRGEQWSVTWSPQYRDDGVGFSTVEYSDRVVNANWLTWPFGIFAGANLPDPVFDFQKHWAFGDLSERNYYIAYKGKAALGGGIGDILMLSGTTMRIPFGPCATTAPTADTLSASTLSAAANMWDATIYITAGTWNIGDVVLIGGTEFGSPIDEVACIRSLGPVIVYDHIEFGNGNANNISTATKLTGVTSGAQITLVYATNSEAHGVVSVATFIAGETVSADVGGFSAVVTRINGGLRFGHAIGSIVQEMTDGSRDSQLKAGALSVLAKTAASWTSLDYMCIGYGTKYAEIRQITKSSSLMSWTQPLSYDHGHYGILQKVTVAGGVFTHTIRESRELPTIQIAADYTDVQGVAALQRRYIGVKCNRGSYRATEGDVLRMSLDDLQARTMRFRDLDQSTVVTPWYSANIVKPVVSFPTTEPYYFSGGHLVLDGSIIARLRDFNLEVSNGLEPKYYLQDANSEGYVPYEIREAKREYRCGITVDVDANERNIFSDLCKMGVYTATFKGFKIVLTFTRGSVNDTITFTLGPDTPAAGGDAQGCLIKTAPHGIMDQPLVSVPLDIDVRKAKIVIVDSVMIYP